MSLSAGDRLGSYEILAPLGVGGMGEVYRARDLTLGRDVAIKILPAAFAADPDRLARTAREARVLAALNHPHIAAIYGVEDGALILELVDGPTLQERLEARGSGLGKPRPPDPSLQTRRALSLDETLAIARQIADALDAAHEKGIIHRDLKPANIKLTKDGSVKVLDFGLATAVAPPDSISRDAATMNVASQAGLFVGTPAYMSPEQARGLPVDKRTDIWSFGCVLFEMLSGKPAFGGDTITDVMVGVVERDPDWAALPPDTPAGIARLLRRCLAKDPKQRFRDIADVRLQIDDGSHSDAASTTARGTSTGTRWRQAAGLAAVVVGAIFAGGLGWRVWSGASPASPRLTRVLKVTNTPAQEFGPAISPDGKWVAYYSNERGPTDVWIKFLDTGATLNATAPLNLDVATKAGIGGLAISPDGSQLAFSARSVPEQPTYDTWVIPAPIGGTPRKLLQSLQGMQWSPDGQRIVCIRGGSSRGDALVLTNADGSSPRDLVAPQGGRHIHWPAWSRDGRYAYFIYTYDTWHTEPSEIYRVPVDGGVPEVVVGSFRRAVYPVPLPGGDLIYSGNPDTVELGLWLQSTNGERRPLTAGVGEHTEGKLSGDGRKLVSTVLTLRQSLVVVPVDGGRPVLQAITDGYGGDLDPSFDGKAGRLVFSSLRSGHRNLWLARPDAGAPRPLTAGTAIDERPSFSPDGQLIAFVSDRGGRRGIWLMNADGGAPDLLAETTVLDTLTWSRDGKRIVFARPGGELPALASVSVADRRVEAFPTPAAAVAPAWSPAADIIAYLQPTSVLSGPTAPPVSRLWLMFADPQGRAVYPDFPKQQFANGLVAWSPDGRRLAAAAVAAGGASSIWIAEPTGREPLRKLLDLPATVRPRGLAWTPDGSSVATAVQEPVSDIVVYDVER